MDRQPSAPGTSGTWEGRVKLRALPSPAITFLHRCGLHFSRERALLPQRVNNSFGSSHSTQRNPAIRDSPSHCDWRHQQPARPSKSSSPELPSFSVSTSWECPAPESRDREHAEANIPCAIGLLFFVL